MVNWIYSLLISVCRCHPAKQQTTVRSVEIFALTVGRSFLVETTPAPMAVGCCPIHFSTPSVKAQTSAGRVVVVQRHRRHPDVCPKKVAIITSESENNSAARTHAGGQTVPPRRFLPTSSSPARVDGRLRDAAGDDQLPGHGDGLEGARRRRDRGPPLRGSQVRGIHRVRGRVLPAGEWGSGGGGSVPVPVPCQGRAARAVEGRCRACARSPRRVRVSCHLVLMWGAR